MIDHVGVGVADVEASHAFYEKALAALGIGLIATIPAGVTEAGGAAYGYGRDGKAFFWIGEGAEASRAVHLAFAAETRAMVDAFHAAALAAGGLDNGSPGLRPHYDPHYYGAFALDPDGNNIEAVCRSAQ